jgi:hypothetical protein
MSSAMPSQLAELIGRFDKALVGSTTRDELLQIESSVEDVIEALGKVARPIRGRSKTGSISAEPPSYAFGPAAAAKATTALHDAAAMKSAAAQQDWQSALDSARRIQVTMSQ